MLEQYNILTEMNLGYIPKKVFPIVDSNNNLPKNPAKSEVSSCPSQQDPIGHCQTTLIKSILEVTTEIDHPHSENKTNSYEEEFISFYNNLNSFFKVRYGGAIRILRNLEMNLSQDINKMLMNS